MDGPQGLQGKAAVRTLRFTVLDMGASRLGRKGKCLRKCRFCAVFALASGRARITTAPLASMPRSRTRFRNRGTDDGQVQASAASRFGNLVSERGIEASGAVVI